MTQKDRYSAALDAFTQRVRGDPNVIALLLSGSLAYGTVWEKSDIDLTMLVRDSAVKSMAEYCVDEDGIDIHLAVMEVSVFKRKMERLRGGEYPHSYFGKGVIYFTKDESLRDFFEDVRKVGKDDAALSFIVMCDHLLGSMNKAEKWMTVFNDPLYAQRFLHNCCLNVADMELLIQNEEPTRESIYRARELNPELMRELYEIPSIKAMTVEEVRHTLKVLDDYLMKHIDVWSVPVTQCLADGEAKAFSRIYRALRIYQGPLDYLAEKGIIGKAVEAFRVFKNSKLQLEEAAYFINQGTGKQQRDQPHVRSDNVSQKERYKAALEGFIDHVKSDPNVIALILYGSLSYGTVWEKSDLDLDLIVRDGSTGKASTMCFIDVDGIFAHIDVTQISAFKRSMGNMRGGGFSHSVMSKGTICFTKDESLHEFLNDAQKMGKDDAALSFIAAGEYMLVEMNRAEKWITVFNDPLYAQRFLQRCCLFAADLVLLVHNEEPTRESILRARKLDPEFMREVYEIPSTTAMTVTGVRQALKLLDGYLMAHIDIWSKPLINYLADGEIKTVSMINKHLGIEGGAFGYLAEKGYIERVTQSSRIMPKSALRLEEVGYLYIDREDKKNGRAQNDPQNNH